MTFSKHKLLKLGMNYKTFTVLGISLVMAAVTLGVVGMATNRPNISLSNPEVNTKAANASCLVTLTRPTPPPPTPSTPPTTCISNPVDIVLAIDRSGTMGTQGVNKVLKIDWAKKAATAFVNTIAAQPANVKANVRIGVVDWAGNNYRVKSLPLTSNFTSVNTYISGVKFLGQTVDALTCIECGIKTSASLLTDTTRRRVVILMSDGIANRITTSCKTTLQTSCTGPTPPACTSVWPINTHCLKADVDAITAATVAKSSGIAFHVVGYGSNVTPVNILEGNLNAISSGPSYYHYGGVETNWETIFKSIAPQICSDVKTP